MIILAQTLSGDWVITISNPEEPGEETELARFQTGTATAPNTAARAAMESAAAVAAIMASIDGSPVDVRSHNTADRSRMQALVNAYDGR